MLEDLTSGTEKERQEFIASCVETLKKFKMTDLITPIFVFERLCNIIHPVSTLQTSTRCFIQNASPSHGDCKKWESNSDRVHNSGGREDTNYSLLVGSLGLKWQLNSRNEGGGTYKFGLGVRNSTSPPILSMNETPRVLWWSCDCHVIELLYRRRMMLVSFSCRLRRTLSKRSSCRAACRATPTSRPPPAWAHS